MGITNPFSSAISSLGSQLQSEQSAATNDVNNPAAEIQDSINEQNTDNALKQIATEATNNANLVSAMIDDTKLQG